MDFETIMAFVGEKIGLEDFKPSEEGECTLALEDCEILIQHCPDVNSILVSAVSPPLPPDLPASAYRRMLAANYLFRETHGATLSLDEKNNRICLMRYDSLDGLEGETFYAHLLAFITAMYDANKRGSEEMEKNNADDQPEETIQNRFRDFFVRV